MKIGDRVTLEWKSNAWRIVEETDDSDPITGTIVCKVGPITDQLYDLLESAELEKLSKIFKPIPQPLIDFYKRQRQLFRNRELYCIHLDYSQEFGSNDLALPWFCPAHGNLTGCPDHGPIDHWDTCYLWGV